MGFYPAPLLFNAIGGGKRGAESGADAVQKAMQQGVAPSTQLVANSSLSIDRVWV